MHINVNYLNLYIFAKFLFIYANKNFKLCAMLFPPTKGVRQPTFPTPLFPRGMN